MTDVKHRSDRDSHFTAEWLDLREPADIAARSSALVDTIAQLLDRDAVKVVDLGTGTGANVRYLIERLPRRQDWELIESDPALLSIIPERMRPRVSADGLLCELTLKRLDLARVDAQDLAEGAHLVTASALLDLVSEDWLRDLIDSCCLNVAAALFALNYDGRVICDPQEPEDDWLRDLVNEHQLTNKGFGPALGPNAVQSAVSIFETIGYTVRCESSDWVLTPGASDELQRQLIQGWTRAAREVAPADTASAIDDWCARRLAHVAAGSSTITVGHVDIAAWPL